jgi:hypothetical protein
MGFGTSTNNHFEVPVELIQNHFELALKKILSTKMLLGIYHYIDQDPCPGLEMGFCNGFCASATQSVSYCHW